MLTCTYLAKRLREISSTKTGSYPHEFLCTTDCSACADYQPCICKKRRCETYYPEKWPSNPRCIVKVFDKYLQHIPREGRLYRKPLVNKGSDTSIRFSVQSIGINTLSNRMKDLFQAAGIPLENRNITNHSGKVTCCTTLFNAGFSDSSVKSRSGHRSGAVETYKRPLEALHDSVSHALQPP